MYQRIILKGTYQAGPRKNPDKSVFDGLKKGIDNCYVLNKTQYLRTVTMVQSLLLNYQHNYNSNRQSQSKGVSNQIMFAQHGKTGDGGGEKKDQIKKPQRNLDHITCNYCGEKGHYAGNNQLSTQTKLKEDAEAFRKMKQEKYGNNPPDGVDQTTLVNVKYASYSLLMGISTKDWDELPSPRLMFCQAHHKKSCRCSLSLMKSKWSFCTTNATPT